MGFGRINEAQCINTEPAPDTRCSDPAFALNNPDICEQSPSLIIKPSVSMVCSLAGVQFSASVFEGGEETDVTSQCVWKSADPNVAVIGAASGNATGLSTGATTISASYQGMTSYAEITVLGENCCDDITTAFMVVIDKTKSMSQAFNANYSTKLAYAKSAAQEFIESVNTQKDTVGLISFTAESYTTHSSLSSDATTVSGLLSAVSQTQQLTTYYDALSAAIDELDAVSADRKVIVLFTDGEDTDTSYSEDDNPIALLSDFKTGGGIVLCVGVRAWGPAYNLLMAFSTGGFFVNAHDATEADTIEYLIGLRGYICGGNCIQDGDEYKASGHLNFYEFTNWDVVDGHVDLLGNGFVDLIPGNGLYLDMSGSSAPYSGKIVTKTGIGVTLGNQYALALRIAGNQRIDLPSNSVRLQVFERNTDGIANPGAPALSAVNSGAVLPVPEVYLYGYSYVNEFGETEITSASIPALNEDTVVSIPVVPNANATLIRVYRTTGESPTSRFYAIAELAPSSTGMTDTMRKADMLAAIAAGTIDIGTVEPTSNTTGTPIYHLNQQITLNDFDQGFTPYFLAFTAISTADVFIGIQQTSTPTGYDAIGLLVDSVVLHNLTDSSIEFEDDFDAENMTYIAPACGTGTTYYLMDNGNYGYADGQNCYGDGCLDSPPPVQTQDPNGLTDIESGYTPPKTYTSTQEECAECEAGFVNGGDGVNLEVVSSDQVGDELTLIFRIASGPTTASVFRYKVTAGATYPKDWTLYGSVDGVSAYVEMDARANNSFGYMDVANFSVETPTPYSYFKIVATNWDFNAGGGIVYPTTLNWEFYYQVSGSECATATATSEDSQQAADTAASNAALTLAQSRLDCIQYWTASATATAKCPEGLVGADVTRSATRTSYVSLLDAQNLAATAAQEAADDALSCVGSNNMQPLTINDRIGATPAKASPYPWVKFISGNVGSIDEVVVAIDGLAHGQRADIHCILESPSGTLIYLFGNAMDNTSSGDVGIETPFHIEFSSVSVTDIPQNGQPANVPYRPKLYGSSALPFPSPGPSGTSYDTDLTALIGEDSNGAWKLWIIDDTSLYGGSGIYWDIIFNLV